MKKERNLIEKAAIYLAKYSVGSSIPLLCHEVEKPENLEKMIEELDLEENAER